MLNRVTVDGHISNDSVDPDEMWAFPGDPQLLTKALKQDLLDEEAFRLRLRGMTFRDIAKELKVSTGCAWGRVERCLAVYREIYPEHPADIRDQGLAALRVAMPHLIDKASTGDLPAIRVMNQVVNTQHRLSKVPDPTRREKKRLTQLIFLHTGDDAGRHTDREKARQQGQTE